MPKRFWVLAAVITMPFVGCASCIVYNRLWWAQVEGVIQEAVASAAQGRQPAEFEVAVERDASHDPAHDFRLPYTAEGADNFLGGVGALDIVTPGVYVAHLRFANDAVYHVEARRRGLFGPWQVALSPAETN